MTAMGRQLGFDVVSGLDEKERGIFRVYENADQEWKVRAMTAIRKWAAVGVPFVADDVRSSVGDPPQGTSPNIMGAILSVAAKSGIVKPAGFTRSLRVARHAGLVRQWIGC